MPHFFRIPLLACAVFAAATLARAQVPTWPKTTPADITAAGIGVQLTGADYGNGTFVLATYFGGTTAVPAITPAVFTSPDGTNWTRRTLPGGTGRTGTPRYVKGRFLLGVTPASSTGSGGNGVIYSSTDGVTWTASAPLGSTINAPTEFAYNTGVYAGPLSSGGMQVATSTDGLTWTPRVIVAGGSAGHITTFNGKFYVNCFGSGTISGLYSSADGVAWTKVAGAPAKTIDSLTLSATGVDNVDTESEAGAAGGVALTPALALSFVEDTATADLGTGGTENIANGVTIAATQQATENTSSKGEAKGSKVAVGAALALALVGDKVSATTARSIDAGGDVGMRMRDRMFAHRLSDTR